MNKAPKTSWQPGWFEVEGMMRATRAILERADFATTARVIFDQARALTGATSGYVALLSEDGAENELLFLEAGGLPCSVDPELPMPIRGLRADAYASAETVFHNDFMNSEWVQFMPAGHVELRNVLFAPLSIKGRVEGIMGLANKPGGFTERERELATVFGEYAAIALANSRVMDELTATVGRLEGALTEIQTLRGIIPICSRCKMIRDDNGFWRQVEEYVSSRTEARFSHGLCEKCADAFADD